MINYLYALDDIKDNIEAYSQEKQIAAAPRIRKRVIPRFYGRFENN
jgi:hypothetical protein